MITREYELIDLTVTVEPDGEFFNIVKVEKYFPETGESLDITKVKSEKLTDYICDRIGKMYAEERAST